MNWGVVDNTGTYEEALRRTDSGSFGYAYAVAVVCNYWSGNCRACCGVRVLIFHAMAGLPCCCRNIVGP